MIVERVDWILSSCEHNKGMLTSSICVTAVLIVSEIEIEYDDTGFSALEWGKNDPSGMFNWWNEQIMSKRLDGTDQLFCRESKNHHVKFRIDTIWKVIVSEDVALAVVNCAYNVWNDLFWWEKYALSLIFNSSLIACNTIGWSYREVDKSKGGEEEGEEWTSDGTECDSDGEWQVGPAGGFVPIWSIHSPSFFGRGSISCNIRCCATGK